MTSMNLDASLDDMIKAAPRKKGGRGGPKKGGAKGGAGGNKNIPKPKGGRGTGGVRAKVIAKPKRGPSGGRGVVAAMDTDTWQHDLFQGAGGRGRGAPGGVGGGTAKLVISNLHYNVSNQDIKASHCSSIRKSSAFTVKTVTGRDG